MDFLSLETVQSPFISFRADVTSYICRDSERSRVVDQKLIQIVARFDPQGCQ